MIDLDEQLREAGANWRSTQPEPVFDFERATTRTWRSRPLLAGVAVVIVVTLAAAAAILASTGSRARVSPAGEGTTATVSPAATRRAITLGHEIAFATILEVGNGGVWVSGSAPHDRAATLEHIDTRTGAVLTKVTLPDNFPFQIVRGDGAVWVASQQGEVAAHLLRIDPGRGAITSILATDGDANVAITPTAIWVDENKGRLVRLDPHTNQSVASIALAGGGYSAHFITSGPSGIWLANPYDGGVWRVDPNANTVRLVIHVGTYAGGLVELAGSLWVTTGRGIAQLDPATGTVIRTIDLKQRILSVISNGRDLFAMTDGPDTEIIRVAPGTGRQSIVALPPRVRGISVIAADVETGAVWGATSEPNPRLIRIVS